MLRSASSWSIGLDETFNKERSSWAWKEYFGYYERSVNNAYLEEIENAKHYIYIENQFFMSTTQKEGIVKNLVAQKLYERIERAVKNKEKFKVFVVRPLVPGFPADLSKDLSAEKFLRYVLYWEYQTISRGENSLFEKLKKITPNPQDYLSFYGLRQHGLLQGKPVTEQIYVHSKTMIIDDQVVICGSANIGDRSQLGWRDSEIVLITKGGKRVKKNIGGQ